jgi:hypothetical protein
VPLVQPTYFFGEILRFSGFEKPENLLAEERPKTPKKKAGKREGGQPPSLSSLSAVRMSVW